MPEWIASQLAKSGELISPRKLSWRLANRKRLKSAFPKAEQRFCKVLDKLRFHLNPSKKKLLLYSRQKLFSIDSEICFYVDFYFPGWKLAVEIDGDSHTGKEAGERDLWRQSIISSFGVTFLRLSNAAVETSDWWEIEDALLNALLGVPGRSVMKKSILDSIADMPSRGRPPRH